MWGIAFQTFCNIRHCKYRLWARVTIRYSNTRFLKNIRIITDKYSKIANICKKNRLSSENCQSNFGRAEMRPYYWSGEISLTCVIGEMEEFSTLGVSTTRFWTLGKLILWKVTLGKMTLEGTTRFLTLGKLTLGKLTLGKMIVWKMTLGKTTRLLTQGKVTLGKMTIRKTTRSSVFPLVHKIEGAWTLSTTLFQQQVTFSLFTGVAIARFSLFQRARGLSPRFVCINFSLANFVN